VSCAAPGSVAKQETRLVALRARRSGGVSTRGYDLSRWSPGSGRSLFPELGQLHRQFEQLFDEAFTSPAPGAPRLSVHETKDAYVVTMDAPGVALTDLEVSWSQEEGLTIRGERKPPTLGEGARALKDEQRHGPFSRTVNLGGPLRADGIEASLELGVLRVLLPKSEEARPRRIEVRPGSTRPPAPKGE
jgi:HSP20 family protein